MWEAILYSLGGYAVLLACLGFLAKSIINHYLSKDIEKYKEQLKANSELAQKELENSLKLIAIEHNIRFKSLHEKRAEVIAELYRRLSEAVNYTRSFLSLFEVDGDKSKPEKYEDAMRKFFDFGSYFEKHRIYFSQDHCDLIDAFFEKLRNPCIEFMNYLDVSPHDPDMVRRKGEVWVQAWRSVRDNIPPAQRALEDEFRKILGVKVDVVQV
jgi:hypothetical protein